MALDTGTAGDRDALAKLGEEHVDHRFKGLPPDAYGLTVAELAGQRRNLFTGGFTTPVLALSAERLEHNLRLMETYSARHGLAFAPHGKTSMAPQLFQRQIEHGAWGITLAVPHQVRVARAFGVQRVFLANELVDAAALRWISSELDADPDFRFVCYVDSVRGVELMDAALTGAGASARWTSWWSWPPARARGPACAPRLSARPSPTRWPGRGRCGWRVSPGTRARCRTPTPRRCAPGCGGWSRSPSTSTGPGGSTGWRRSW